jgi:ABC-type sugar transport system ATPase subunit
VTCANGGPPASRLLELADIEKSYGGVRALRGATLTIASTGAVHTLSGQNGCGKSSLLGVLSGQIRPDAGEIRLDGRRVHFRDAADAVRHGIAMVSQETAVAEDLTVMENVLLGRLVRGRGGINWPASRRRARTVLARLGLDYNPDWVVRKLRPDQKQMVEIARAISLDARLLILDEPTSSLTEHEAGELFTALRVLTQGDVAVLFVSHRLAEVFEISTDVTVMRDGRTVSAGPIGNYTPRTLVRHMVGGVDLHGGPVASGAVPADDGGPPVLQVRGLCSPAAFKNLDLDVRAGELLGIAGLDGSGRSELLEAVFGLRPVSAGSVALDGVARSRATPRASIANGIGYVPPNRKTQGLVLPMSVTSNVTMVATRTASRLRPPARRAERRTAAQIAAVVRLRAASLSSPVRSLSGGNQQKVLLGKWMAARPRILLLDDPTRGVDVAAKAEIHTQLRQAAADGMAVLVTSSEIAELVDLCDEVTVMYRGEVIRRFTRTELSEAGVATAAAGG